MDRVRSTSKQEQSQGNSYDIAIMGLKGTGVTSGISLSNDRQKSAIATQDDEGFIRPGIPVQLQKTLQASYLAQ